MNVARPRRPRLVAGNWKMNKTVPEAEALARALVERAAQRPAAQVLLCPPFTALGAVRGLLAQSPLMLGAQNLHPEASGSYTGEVSGPMLITAGCRWVIVGHSERRQLLGEDDALVARKLRAALRAELTPIVCVGETLAERERDETVKVLERQVGLAFEGLDRAAACASVIAYEPVWAIGTGRVATAAQAVSAHRRIRATLDRVIGAGIGGDVTILYGGSVSPSNAAELFAEHEIDGALVGGASLDAGSFWSIVEAA